jgi:signal transduction histidine kinase
MMRARKGISIFWQTLLLLIASLVVTQAISIALIITLPQPRPDFLRMSEIADTLAGRLVDRQAIHRHHGERYPSLPFLVQNAPPSPKAAMTQNAPLTRDLAERIGVDQARIRLYFKPDQHGYFPFARQEPGQVVPMRRGEPIFFDTVIAAYNTGQGWRVLQSPERPPLSEWQRRSILLFGVSLLVLLPFAWFFARRLARPIRRFAEAADRLGRDANAPPVPVEGPVELRTTAHALNGMQTRVADYLRERTAMIAAIAHDLRTPLARIAFRIESVEDAVREPVQNDIEQMRAMIAATMDFVKGNAQIKQHVAIDLREMLGSLAAKAVAIGQDVRIGDVAVADVTGDPLSLQRLFQNLIDNALAFGGAAEISIRAEADRVRVLIADRGPGLPDAMLETVFDPFTRNEGSRNRMTGGVGLGLTIARMIAADHGGTLTLANRDGGGLVANVVLPSR